MPAYDPNNQAINNQLKLKANEQLTAFIYLENSDHKKYGSVLKNLNSKNPLEMTSTQRP
jgi:hypothetical protein